VNLDSGKRTRREMLRYLVLSTQYCWVPRIESGKYPPLNQISEGRLLPEGVETWTVFAEDVRVTEHTLAVKLSDGRSVSAPVVWFPRLVHGTREERNNWDIGSGIGIHWPDLDEDISVEGLLTGGPSRESGRSLQRWLDSRKQRKAG
jgi:hypothetical protein